MIIIYSAILTYLLIGLFILITRYKDINDFILYITNDSSKHSIFTLVISIFFSSLMMIIIVLVFWPFIVFRKKNDESNKTEKDTVRIDYIDIETLLNNGITIEGFSKKYSITIDQAKKVLEDFTTCESGRFNERLVDNMKELLKINDYNSVFLMIEEMIKKCDDRYLYSLALIIRLLMNAEYDKAIDVMEQVMEDQKNV